jgi:hypothetical protein
MEPTGPNPRVRMDSLFTPVVPNLYRATLRVVRIFERLVAARRQLGSAPLREGWRPDQRERFEAELGGDCPRRRPKARRRRRQSCRLQRATLERRLTRPNPWSRALRELRVGQRRRERIGRGPRPRPTTQRRPSGVGHVARPGRRERPKRLAPRSRRRRSRRARTERSGGFPPEHPAAVWRQDCVAADSDSRVGAGRLPPGGWPSGRRRRS